MWDCSSVIIVAQNKIKIWIWTVFLLGARLLRDFSIKWSFLFNYISEIFAQSGGSNCYGYVAGCRTLIGRWFNYCCQTYNKLISFNVLIQPAIPGLLKICSLSFFVIFSVRIITSIAVYSTRLFLCAATP